MSGNGGSNDHSTGSGDDKSAQDCGTLTGQGTIMSPDPKILPLLKIGEILDIGIRSVTGPIQAFTKAGQLVGSVFLPGNLSAAFISCINDNNDYQARITSLIGGLCELLITIK
jgi:hypothetical protein